MRNLSDYPKTLPGSDTLPYGMLKNESIPGARDGTDIQAEQLQDVYYPLYQVLGLAGVTPSGELENARDTKQFLNSLANISWLKYESSLIYRQNSIVLHTINNITTAYRSIIDNNTLPLNDEAGWKAIFTIDAEHNLQMRGGGGKVDLDGNNATFTNLLPTTQGLLAQQAFRLVQPSADNLITLSVSSFTYTAPCDGFVELRAEKISSAPAAVSLTNLTTNIIQEIQPTTSGYGLTIVLPCVEGDKVLYRISGTLAIKWIYFRPCRYVQSFTF